MESSVTSSFLFKFNFCPDKYMLYAALAHFVITNILLKIQKIFNLHSPLDCFRIWHSQYYSAAMAALYYRDQKILMAQGVKCEEA